jgi:diamine N-acetyltransferase
VSSDTDISDPRSTGRARVPRLPVTIQPVSRDNWEAVIALRVDPDQADHLASNLYSLAEAYVEPNCQPRAIVAGRTVIGFVMYEYIASNQAFNIPRFMIDADWQGRGYGRASLRAIIGGLKAERPEAGITISLMPYNTHARRLYARMGFVDTGTQFYGEDVLRFP